MFRRIRNAAANLVNRIRGRRAGGGGGQLALPPGSRGRARTSGS